MVGCVCSVVAMTAMGLLIILGTGRKRSQMAAGKVAAICTLFKQYYWKLLGKHS